MAVRPGGYRTKMPWTTKDSARLAFTIQEAQVGCKMDAIRDSVHGAGRLARYEHPEDELMDLA
jgi:hypothetical protein